MIKHKRQWETHLYTYAYFVLDLYDNITAKNKAKMKQKALKHHTKSEVEAVEIDPLLYIHTGKLAA